MVNKQGHIRTWKTGLHIRLIGQQQSLSLPNLLPTNQKVEILITSNLAHNQEKGVSCLDTVSKHVTSIFDKFF